MPPDQRWNRFANADEEVLRRAQSAALTRFVREELAPFSKHYGSLFERVGFDPRRGVTPADLATLPATEPRELLRAQGLDAHRAEFLLRPTPAKIKAAWSFGRKLALGLGGERAREQLVRTYAPCFRTRERVEDDWLFVEHTRYDLEVLGEHGARAFGFLGLDRPGKRLLSLSRPGPGIEHWAFLQGGWQSGTVTAHDLDLSEPGLVEDFAPTALAGPAADVLALLEGARERRLDLGALELCLLCGTGIPTEDKRRAADALTSLGATEPIVCRAFTHGLARALFVEPPADVDADPGFIVSPDLCYFELVEPGTNEPAASDAGGELLLSSVASRGTSVLRYRTGLQVDRPLDWSRCPWSGLGLPRLPSGLCERT
ncbi:MAG: hypothetical protein H6831_04205 [Planctomycetes bacterium]|nr:hypothetical protein [Planctomycetota bacterium]MCB9903590.1 hypothetical protein [Planctomycetota bacterium]